MLTFNRSDAININQNRAVLLAYVLWIKLRADDDITVLKRWETVLAERDFISVPPGVYREEINIGIEDALMCVMLGSPTPVRPTYPPDSPLAAIQRD